MAKQSYSYEIEVSMCEEDEKVSEFVFEKMQEGYVLTMSPLSTGKYLLRKGTGTERSDSLSRETKNKIYDLLHKFGCHYFSNIPISEYSSVPRYREAVDVVLEYLNVGLILDGVHFVFIDIDEK